MDDLYIFKYSHPTDMLVPEQFISYFDQCVTFARNILKTRSVDDIVNTMKDIDTHLNNEYVNAFKTLEVNEYTQLVSLENFWTVTGRTGTAEMLRLYEKDDKSIFLHLSNPGWDEIFSIYTYGLIAYAVRDLTYMSEQPDLNRDDYLFEMAGYYVAEAMEVSTIADFLNRRLPTALAAPKQVVSVVKERQRIASKGGKARSAKYDALKKLIREEYFNAHSSKSNKQAARDILHSMPKEKLLDSNGVRLLNEYNAIDQVARWIGELKRSQHSTL